LTSLRGLLVLAPDNTQQYIRHFTSWAGRKAGFQGGKEMKVLVAYYSMSGNTEKLAKAIHDEASKSHESYLKKVDEVDQKWLNLVPVFFPAAATILPQFTSSP